MNKIEFLAIVLLLMVLLVWGIADMAYPMNDPGINVGIRDSELSTIIIGEDSLGRVSEVKINKNINNVIINEDEGWVTIILQDKCEPLPIEDFKKVETSV